MASLPTLKHADELLATAKAMISDGRGLLAADESTGTIGKRFDTISLANEEPNRQAYRQLLFTSPEFGKYISGVILYEETLFQKHDDGTPFVDLIKAAGSIPGIKVDLGMKQIPGCPEGDCATQGMDNLGARLAKYYDAGARFAKWRAAYTITDVQPTRAAVVDNARSLAMYASLCQANGIVPIVEPEVLQDGSHTIERSFEVTRDVLAETFRALHLYNVDLERMILKPNMVMPGYDHPRPAPEVIAEWTLKVLRATVPAAVPGIMFLSGGMTEVDSTANLDALNRMPAEMRPWGLSYSYGRALQSSAISTWKGSKDNVPAAQEAFLKRARSNTAAAKGEWTKDMEA